MKKILIIALIALMVGCGQEEKEVENEEIQEEEKQVVNAPTFVELELVETEYTAGFTYWYYVTAIDSEMALEILDNWAQSEGFEKSDNLGYVYAYTSDAYQRDMAIIRKGETPDYPEKTMFRINMPVD